VSVPNPEGSTRRAGPAEPVIRSALPADLPAVLELLEAAGLPGGGVAEWLPHFVVAESGGALAGVAGLEVYGDSGLLRSVAVAQEWRGLGHGSALVARALAAAQAGGVRTACLLTETAEGYFLRHGFRRIARERVPAAVQASIEFRELCPSSSTVMMLTFDSGE